MHQSNQDNCPFFSARARRSGSRQIEKEIEEDQMWQQQELASAG
jgi:hypothetical protein